MSTTSPTLTVTRNACTTIAAALAVTRSASLLGFFPMPDWSIAAAMVLFVITVTTAAWTGYQVRIRRAVAQQEEAVCQIIEAKQEIARLRAVAEEQSRETRLQQEREAEERSWWASDSNPEDTIAFGPTVVPSSHRFQTPPADR